MTQRFTLTITCDDGLAPDCHRERRERHDNPRPFDTLAFELFKEGWQRGYRGDGSGQTYDVCPACAALAAGPPTVTPGP